MRPGEADGVDVTDLHRGTTSALEARWQAVVGAVNDAVLMETAMPAERAAARILEAVEALVELHRQPRVVALETALRELISELGPLKVHGEPNSYDRAHLAALQTLRAVEVLDSFEALGEERA